MTTISTYLRRSSIKDLLEEISDPFNLFICMSLNNGLKIGYPELVSMRPRIERST